ncbi:MAG: helix-turn-helix transcriptional regulator [bacterium]|nr:helix-turn-helix transcriptional regulator [bacterium]
MSEIIAKINERILTARKAFGLTQEDMSKQMGVSRSHFAKIEKNLQSPSYNFLLKLSEKFNVSLDWLISGRGQMQVISNDHFLNKLEPEHVDFLEEFFSLSKEKQKKFLQIFLEIISTGKD